MIIEPEAYLDLNTEHTYLKLILFRQLSRLSINLMNRDKDIDDKSKDKSLTFSS